MSITTISWAATLEDKVRAGCATNGLSADACRAIIAECQRMQQVEQWLLALHVGAIVLALTALGQLAQMVREVHRTRGIRTSLAAAFPRRAQALRHQPPLSSTQGPDQ